MGYRKIWQRVHGPIPKDEKGRTYEIHHLDGNRKNNDIGNLKCLSLQEHYDLHLQQGDFAAAFRIAQRMTISVEEKSELMSKSNTQRLLKGTHPFIDKNVRAKALETITKQVKEGTHNLLKANRKPEWQEQANKTYNTNHNRSELVKKGWSKYKQENPGNVRTIAGARAGADKTRNTKWYHKEDGSHLRTQESDPRLKDGWILGRFNINLKKNK